MIVVMKRGASKKQVKHVIERVEAMGMKAHPIYGTNRTVVAAVGDKREVDRTVLEACSGVERVMKVLAPYKLASREVREEDTVVPLRSRASGPPSALIGGNKVGVIAGPCTVENKTETIKVAESVKEAGAIALRGGAFKPRTSPYSFQGLMEEGLEYLAAAREATGLPIVTEVMTPEHLSLVTKFADVFQIGARNMQNFLLLKAVGEADKPVLLKRGMSASLEEFLLAAEYILSQGNPYVILCERGIRTFENHTRNTLSLAIVPALKELTHLPVIVDPSHGTGKASLVPPMSRGAIAVGADGLLIEVHPEPERALSDGAQSLTLEGFKEMMNSLRPVAQALGRDL
ncbi:MAG: 3-deoxy-7-phosphoheptulonate synthase [Planctomycetes bacterium DG_23]|nr:MAG: 3-deoxy-7-phosphoheptulonate synthase [Planctomycetes bacterium DG_23]